MADDQSSETTIAKLQTYDPARTLTNSILGMVWVLIGFVGAIVAFQVWKNGKAESETWGQLMLLIGFALAKAGDILNNRFGSTRQSASKDATVEQLSRTVAKTQSALLDPAVIVTVDPTKRAASATDAMRVDTVNREARATVVYEVPTKESL
jgi:hypothetical protein